MTLRTLKIGNREFVLLARQDFVKLAAQAQRQTEDDYWTKAALEAEAKARTNRESPISFAQVEHELDERTRPRGAAKRRRGR